MSSSKQEPVVTPKPWGKELLYCKTDHYAFKKLCIMKGHRFSYQYHKEKEESWFILKGVAEITYGNHHFYASPGEFIHVPPMTNHRIGAPNEDVEVLEVSTPHLEDIVRLEDDYHRT